MYLNDANARNMDAENADRIFWVMHVWHGEPAPGRRQTNNAENKSSRRDFVRRGGGGAAEGVALFLFLILLLFWVY